jgi:xylulokinase
MRDIFFIGIDAGTTSMKGILTDDEGNVHASAMEEYTIDMNGDQCEIEAEVYWEKTVAVVRALLAKSNVDKDSVKALSFSSQGETLIGVDHLGVPLRKAIVWLDNRSRQEALSIEKHFGLEEICYRTGQPQVQPLWPATRILWLKENEPNTFNKIRKFLLVEDYLIFKLTGKFVTEQTLVSSTLYYAIREKTWWYPMLDFLGITEKELPEVLPSATVIATVIDAAQQATGLSSSTMVVTGAYDHVAGALGAGNFSEGSVSETTGTAMAMVVTLDHVIPNFVINIPMQCHALAGKYLLLPYGQTAGLVLKWFKDEFCAEEIQALTKTHNAEDIYDRIIHQAENISPGSDGLIMLPHLMGSGSPEFNAHARGVFAGITAGMTKGHFIRAILESIACLMKRNLEVLKVSNIQVTEVRALGGGSKSKLWNQIKADMANIPIITVRGQETAALGAVILAATGTGFFASIESACQKMVKIGQTFFPDTKAHTAYQPVYARYVRLTHYLEKYWEV